MTEFKTEIEKIIDDNTNAFSEIQNQDGLVADLIQLFNKHIEGKGDNIAGKIIDHDYDSLSSGETATNIINILKIKE